MEYQKATFTLFRRASIAMPVLAVPLETVRYEKERINRNVRFAATLLFYYNCCCYRNWTKTFSLSVSQHRNSSQKLKPIEWISNMSCNRLPRNITDQLQTELLNLRRDIIASLGCPCTTKQVRPLYCPVAHANLKLLFIFLNSHFVFPLLFFFLLHLTPSRKRSGQNPCLQRRSSADWNVCSWRYRKRTNNTTLLCKCGPTWSQSERHSNFQIIIIITTITIIKISKHGFLPRLCTAPCIQEDTHS